MKEIKPARYIRCEELDFYSIEFGGGHCDLCNNILYKDVLIDYWAGNCYVSRWYWLCNNCVDMLKNGLLYVTDSLHMKYIENRQV